MKQLWDDVEAGPRAAWWLFLRRKRPLMVSSKTVFKALGWDLVA